MLAIYLLFLFGHVVDERLQRLHCALQISNALFVGNSLLIVLVHHLILVIFDALIFELKE